MRTTLLPIVLAAGLTACQTKSTKSALPILPPPPTIRVEVTPSHDAPAPAPPPVTTRKRVAVILGPGGAKAFAHVGVLRALQQQRIPIEKIVGLEWGSLVGALYAHKGQVNDLDWKLYKMEQQNLPRPKGFFRRGEDTVKVMDEFLGEAFQRDELKTAKIGFSCPARAFPNGAVTWASHGFFKDVIRRCLAYPPTFKVDSGFVAGAALAGEAIEQLQAEGFNVIVLVNVLGNALAVPGDAIKENATAVILWQELRRAVEQASRLGVETITVDTSAHPVLQYESFKELRALGERAGQAAAAGLVHKYGL